MLWLTSEQGTVIIRVWDNSSQMPVRRDAGLYAEGGRGVALVAAIANDWGAYRKLLGKVTWCMLASNSDGVAMKDERKHRLAAVMGARYYPTEPASPWFTPAASPRRAAPAAAGGVSRRTLTAAGRPPRSARSACRTRRRGAGTSCRSPGRARDARRARRPAPSGPGRHLVGRLDGVRSFRSSTPRMIVLPASVVSTEQSRPD